MKTFILILSLLFILVSCKEMSDETKPSIQSKINKHPDRMKCNSEADPFKCQKLACQNANGHYNDLTKVCSCPKGSLFFSQYGGACLLPDFSKDKVLSFSKSKNSPFYISGSSTNLPDMRIQELTSSLSLPLLMGQNQLKIYTDASQMASLSKELLQGLFNLGFPATELDWYESNSGFKNENMMSRTAVQFVFINDDSDDNTLVAHKKIKMGIQLLTDFNRKSEVQSFSELGCAEICTEKTELINDDESKVYRVRVFSGGNPIQDSIILFNKITHDTEQMLVLFNQRASHLYISDGHGGYEVYKYSGEKIATAQSLDQNFPEKIRRFDNEKQTPVAIFEGQYNNVADSAAVFGPFLESSYYGWFNETDERPFYYGKTITLLGEEDFTDPVHSALVSRVASENLTKPILPFSISSLINGDFDKVISRVPFKKFVASFSAAFTYTTETCKASSLAKTIESTQNTILWFTGAGNEGTSVNKSDLIYCPQSLEKKNLIIVAATNGSDSLSKVSTFGENYADIAANGCSAAEETCELGATSFASPKAARSAANLITQFPELSIEQVKFTLLMTARVPYSKKSIFVQNEYLKVKSGGVLDETAARLFLNEIMKYNMNLNTFDYLKATDEERELVLNSLIKAKAQQYKDLNKNQITKLINNHFEYLTKHY